MIECAGETQLAYITPPWPCSGSPVVVFMTGVSHHALSSSSSSEGESERERCVLVLKHVCFKLTEMVKVFGYTLQ